MAQGSGSNDAMAGEMARLRSTVSEMGSLVRQTNEKTDQIDHGIAAMKLSFENLYRILHSEFEKIIGQLANVERLPELFSSLEKVTAEQFKLSFLRQFEAQIVAQMSGILANQNRIQALEAFLEEKHRGLEEDCKRVAERYDALLEKLRQSNHDRRRQLDSHAYALLEAVYPRQIQPKFESLSLPCYRLLADHAMQSSRARSGAIGGALSRVQRAIADHLNRRAEALDALEKWADVARQPGRYSIPFWVVEVEDVKTGRKRLELVPPEGAESIPDEMLQRMLASAEAMARSLPAHPMAPEEREAVVRHLEEKFHSCPSEASIASEAI